MEKTDRQRGEAVAVTYMKASVNINMNAGSGPREQKGGHGSRRDHEREADGVSTLL